MEMHPIKSVEAEVSVRGLAFVGETSSCLPVREYDPVPLFQKAAPAPADCNVLGLVQELQGMVLQGRQEAAGPEGEATVADSMLVELWPRRTDVVVSEEFLCPSGRVEDESVPLDQECVLALDTES